MKTKLIVLAIACLISSITFSQSTFNGLDLNMGNLYRMSNAKTRSISPENFTGEKGKGGMARLEDKDKPNAANAASAAPALLDMPQNLQPLVEVCTLLGICPKICSC